MTKIEQLKQDGKDYIGFYGFPPREALEYWRAELGLELLDLDIYFGAPDAGIIPPNFCQIIATIINNAVALRDKLKVIIAAVGMEKCDSGRYAARLLQEIGISNIIATTNETSGKPHEIIISTAKGPLKKRAVRIMETIITPLSQEETVYYKSAQCNPTHGFWGTPPHPIKLLDLFPEATHIFGWTRAVEAELPADLDVEMAVPDDIPIVFFAQSFCNKAQLAQYLAKKHNGMFVDSHQELNRSLTARVEAFIRLNSDKNR